MREKLIDDVHSELMGLLQRTPNIRSEDVNRQYEAKEYGCFKSAEKYDDLEWDIL